MAISNKSVFIQDASGEMYYLDATLSVSYQQSGTPTQYRMEGGSNSSDHYTQNQDTININGLISAVKMATREGESTSLEDFEVKMTALKKSGRFFSVTFSDNLEVLRNCLFTSLNMERNTDTGRYSMTVDMSIVQVEIAKRASLVTTPIAIDAYSNMVDVNSKSGGNTVEVSKRESNELCRAIRKSFVEDGGTINWLFTKMGCTKEDVEGSE